MNSEFLPYDPGTLPLSPAPEPGDSIEFEVDGLPPWKDENASIRNPSHRLNARLLALRAAATSAMPGRAWTHEAVSLTVEMRAPGFEAGRSLIDYVGGIIDTLDGSHGVHFTYLPVVDNDDCQVYAGQSTLVEAETPSYKVHVVFGSPALLKSDGSV